MNNLQSMSLNIFKVRRLNFKPDIEFDDASFESDSIFVGFTCFNPWNFHNDCQYPFVSSIR